MFEKEILAAIRERGEMIKNEIISWRRLLHAIPELRMDTPKTESEIVMALRDIGVSDIRSGTTFFSTKKQERPWQWWTLTP